MRGAYYELLGDLPAFSHNSRGDKDKEKRYAIGGSRAHFLERNGLAFGENFRADGEHIIAFIVEVDQEDLHPEMPHETRIEYFVCSIKPDKSKALFAYLWFPTIEDAKKYAQSKNLKLLKGWGK